MNCMDTAAAVTALAYAMASGRSAEEVEMLGLVFTQLGDTLATIAQCME